MPRPLILLIYNLLLPVVLVVGFPAFILKGIRRGGLARNFRQRFGIYSSELRDLLSGKKPIWIHAVSVGEIFLALKLIEAIQARAPGKVIVLSTTTTTGYAVAAEKASDRLIVVHNPVDLPWIAAKVAHLIDPAVYVLIEAEVWPNLVGSLKRRGVPVILSNARLSPRSARRYVKFRSFVEPIFSQLDAITIPFEADRERWKAIGIADEKIRMLGSVKFDSTSAAGALEAKENELREWLSKTGFPENARILLGGSTHDTEELLLAETVRNLKSEFPDLQPVIIPRHAERGASIADQLREAGFTPILRADSTLLDDRPDPVQSSTQEGRVWIANTTGELRAWFHHAEVVVIGKSFGGEGGQNPVEPILVGKPVIVGPNMQNFSDVVGDLLRVEGLVQVKNAEALPAKIQELLENPEAGKRHGQARSRSHVASRRLSGSECGAGVGIGGNQSVTMGVKQELIVLTSSPGSPRIRSAFSTPMELSPAKAHRAKSPEKWCIPEQSSRKSKISDGTARSMVRRERCEPSRIRQRECSKKGSLLLTRHRLIRNESS